jgi:hypothetical protein
VAQLFINGVPKIEFKREVAILKLGIADSVELDKEGNETLLLDGSVVTLSDQDKADIEEALQK